MFGNPNGAGISTEVPEPPASNLYAKYTSPFPVQNNAL
jgi:hypothetical protein